MSEAWFVALEALNWVELDGKNEDSALRKTFKKLKIKNNEVSNQASNILYAVLKRKNTIDYLINLTLESHLLERLEVGLRSFLRLYTYMIHYTECSHIESQQFINQIRNVLDDKKLKSILTTINLISSLKIPWGQLSREEKLAYKNFLPLWYVNYLYRTFDEQTAADLIQPIDAPKYVRVNQLKGDDAVINWLTSKGFQFKVVPELNHTYCLLGDSTGLTSTKPYREGIFILQDKASILVSEVAAPKQNDIVLDVCAAPGVKTSHLAAIMSNQGKIISIDSNSRRLASWKRLINKMGVTNAESMLVDATSDYKIPTEEVNLIILDPPCSGTGTFNKIPSSKWRVTQKLIEENANIQKILIEKASTHLKKGGFLVYSTCSITIEENEEVIKNFLETHPGFRLVEPNYKLGKKGLLGLEEAQRLYPSVHKCDGFFIAKLEKYQL
ncbi:RsmB/NOP family class I SAM-dependent RNA methyltransferase [Candidatus Bathyarchaeota archaeon]|nr:RsmB/NOP family class I SAM-dependent RNA methyltransferase [Candidatus Bathyarchaeota archaeon]